MGMEINITSEFGGAISAADLRDCIQKSNRRVSCVPPLYKAERGNDLELKIDESGLYTRGCFVLSGNRGDQQCSSCLSSRQAYRVVYLPQDHPTSPGKLAVNCCDSVDIQFLFMGDSDFCGLKSFNPCESDPGISHCLCVETEDGSCFDRSGCLVFCAYFDKDINAWVSDHRPNPTSQYRVVEGVSAGTQHQPGCGLVIEQDPFGVAGLSDDEAQACCDFPETNVGDEIVDADMNDMGVAELSVTLQPSLCPIYCVRLGVFNVEGLIRCASTEVKVGGVHVETTYTIDGIDYICFRRNNTSGLLVEVTSTIVFEPENLIGPPQAIIEKGKARVFADVLVPPEFCEGNTDCTDLIYTDRAGAQEVEIYNTGSYIEEGAIVLGTKDHCCRLWATQAPKGSIIDCEGCLKEQGFCTVMTVEFPKATGSSLHNEGLVNESYGDPDLYFTQTGNTPTIDNRFEWPDWDGTTGTPCECTDCSWWNRVHELEFHWRNDGEGCLFSLQHDCYVPTPMPCGPFKMFGCADVGDHTQIFVDVECGTFLAGCYETRYYVSILSLDVVVKGCNVMKWTFPPFQPIPKEGDMCIQANSACTGSNSGSTATGGVCQNDYGSLSRCDERIFDVIEFQGTDIQVSTSVNVCHPSTGSANPDNDLIYVHDHMNCQWSARVFPIVCLRRCL